ncbi:unnamed protein product, partial [Tetraodon nigroviridis]
VSNPIPSNLRSEAKKAARILRDFTEISNRNGPDKLIPAHVIAKAEGLAIISVIKAGFMVTARAGSGIVIARLADRRWSAPSAIGIAGLGGGFEIGVEVSDLVIILNQRRAIEAFTKGGEPDAGWEPHGGRGTCGQERGGRRCSPQHGGGLHLLSLQRFVCRHLFGGVLPDGTQGHQQEVLLQRRSRVRHFERGRGAAAGVFRPLPHPGGVHGGLHGRLDQQKYGCQDGSAGRKNALYPSISVYKSETSTAGQLVVTATHSFTGQQPGDLSFAAGDSITVITRTDTQNDWWEGRLADGRVGIFPANFVTF